MDEAPRRPFRRAVPAGWRIVTMSEDAAERAAADWFVRLREAPGDTQLRAAFEAWLAADPLHGKAWNDMQQTAQLIRAAPLERRAYKIPAAHPTAARSRPFQKWGTAAVAAIAACLLIVAAPSLLLMVEADRSTRAGEVQTVRLADGSSVVLGPRSATAVAYTGQGRTVRLLSGQAMFEVNHNPAQPFRVIAGDVTTTVLGTGFEVRRVGEATEVAVRHGRVLVEDAEVKPALRRELTAGEWVRVTPDARLESGMEAPALVGDWQTGTVSIHNRPIADAIDEMRPWYGGRIILADADLGGRRITGTYDFRDPTKSLALLVAPYGGRVIRITPWLMIVTSG